MQANKINKPIINIAIFNKHDDDDDICLLYIDESKILLNHNL